MQLGCQVEALPHHMGPPGLQHHWSAGAKISSRSSQHSHTLRPSPLHLARNEDYHLLVLKVTQLAVLWFPIQHFSSHKECLLNTRADQRKVIRFYFGQDSFALKGIYIHEPGSGSSSVQGWCAAGEDSAAVSEQGGLLSLSPSPGTHRPA